MLHTAQNINNNSRLVDHQASFFSNNTNNNNSSTISPPGFSNISSIIGQGRTPMCSQFNSGKDFVLFEDSNSIKKYGGQNNQQSSSRKASSNSDFTIENYIQGHHQPAFRHDSWDFQLNSNSNKPIDNFAFSSHCLHNDNSTGHAVNKLGTKENFPNFTNISANGSPQKLNTFEFGAPNHRDFDIHNDMYRTGEIDEDSDDEIGAIDTKNFINLNNLVLNCEIERAANNQNHNIVRDNAVSEKDEQGKKLIEKMLNYLEI